MRSCKAAVCAALALCLFIFSCAPVFADGLFTDVSENDWFYSQVEGAKQAGIIGGYPDNSFKPNQNVSRQESLTMIYQTLLKLGLLKTEDDLSEQYRSQLSASKTDGWAARYVAYAFAQGIAEADDFASKGGAKAPAERELIAKWTARAFELPDIAMRALAYADASEVSSDKFVYVCAMQRYGLMTGDNNNRVHPRDGIRRCEFASICVRLLAFTRPDSLQTSTRLLYGRISGFDAKDDSFDLTDAAGAVTRVQLAQGAKLFVDGSAAAFGSLAGLAGSVCLSSAAGPSFSAVATTGMQVRSAVVRAVSQGDDYTLLTLQLDGGTADLIASQDTVRGVEFTVGNTITYIAEGGMLLEVN